ncbi:MAG: tetratricopeptide repeat protein [Sedimentisphaerales bacterium]|nr:tetratricopeptide repeat protein [Sedimentisphaerales bacterium]
MEDKDSIFGATPEGLDRLVFEAWQNPETNRQDQPTLAAQILLEQPGGRIGRYKLLSVLGEGGMGVVYLAEQQRPVRRQVALKVIKPGMDSKRVLARFEAEQQALALMEHPHVARVYDAGVTPGARPYFVMEYVQGVPVTEYCDKHRLTVEERLRLFLHVCEAVQHAHQKGVIHRDLKPSNILVTAENEKAVPKVIDFGVARAISQPLTERTLHTEQGQLVGTPEYMSPEQADASNGDIDTRTDVYSLGVVLYELIAGVLPFDPDTLREHGIDGARKVICEQDPQTPSTKLSRTSMEESTESAQKRRTSPRQLQRTLRGDLDWITLKAMEKDRTRRYASAGEFAADILRHLNHEPVSAGRPSLTYKARKFMRRNRALVTGLAAVLTVLIGGAIVSLAFAVKAQRAGRDAAAVTDFLQNYVFRAMDASERGGLRVNIKEALDIASQEVSSQFGDSPLVEASIRKELGGLYANVACFKKGEDHLRWSLETFRRELGREDPRTIEVLDGLGRLYWGWWRYREAEEFLCEALEARSSVRGPEHPDTIGTGRWLGWTYYAQGYTKKAEQSLAESYESTRRILGESHPETIQSMFFHGCALLSCGRNDEAEETLTRALELSAEALSPTHPLVAYPSALLGRLYSRQGRYVEAENLLGNALAISREAWGEHNGGTFHNVAALAENYARQGQVAKAENLLLEAVRRGESPEGSDSEIAVQTLPYPAFFYLWQRRYGDAEDSVKKSHSAGLARYGQQHPITFLNTIVLGMVYRQQERHDDAEELLRRAVDFAREYFTDESVATAAALHELAALYQRQGKYAEAERLHLEVLNIQRHLLVENHWHTLGTVKDLIALYAGWGRPREARKWFNVLETARAEQAAASRYTRARPASIRHDSARDAYTLTASAFPSWAIEKELNFSLPEPSSEMWQVCDDLHFAHKTLVGDGSITAKIEGIDPNHYSIQAGVMVRSTLDPTSPHAAVVITPLGDVAFQYRTVELGAALSRYAADEVQQPHWLRLTRRGNLFAAQHSPDGVTWNSFVANPNSHEPASVEIPMDETLYIGLTVSSHNTARKAEAVISHVTVTGSLTPSGPFSASQDIRLRTDLSGDK